jgi:hypothetical protein
MTSALWIDDLHTLAVELPKRHVEPFRRITRDQFHGAVDSLALAIPHLSPAQVVLGFSRLVALIGDGHTSFFPSDQDVVPFDHSYPLRLFDFDDGLYVVAAPFAEASLVGRRVTRIGSLEADSAMASIAPYIARDNDMEIRYTAPDLLLSAEVLHALGISASPDSAVFGFDGDRPLVVTLHAVADSALDRASWKPANAALGDTAKSASPNFLFSMPWMLAHRHESYWFTARDSDHVAYFQYNQCWDQKGRASFAAAADSMFAWLDAHPAYGLVVDMRQNFGGEPKVARPLIDGIVARPRLMAPGRLHLLVGRRTFSAALTNAAELRWHAHAITVGEPPRGRPNSPSEGRDLVLPHSRAHVSISTKWVRRYPELGNAAYLPIDIPVSLKFADYQRGVDAVYEAAVRGNK